MICAASKALTQSCAAPAGRPNQRRVMPATTTENEMRKLHVGTSPLTNRIYAGHVLKDGATWGEGKQDVTGAACGAVCEHVLANGEPVMVTCNGKPKYEITVREL